MADPIRLIAEYLCSDCGLKATRYLNGNRDAEKWLACREALGITSGSATVDEVEMRARQALIESLRRRSTAR